MTDLLDVNVLLALAWPNHVSHHAALLWANTRPVKGFATCPITECGFIRLSLNPVVVSEAVGMAAILSILTAYKNLAGHEFWPDDLEAHAVFSSITLPLAHRQITDAYLLSLAKNHKGRLVTFDKGIHILADKEMSGNLLILE